MTKTGELLLLRCQKGEVFCFPLSTLGWHLLSMGNERKLSEIFQRKTTVTNYIFQMGV